MLDEEDRRDLTSTAEGDRAAFSRLVGRHRGAVFRFARTLTAEDGAAEDVLQETFVQVLRGAETFRGTGTVRGWILGIARNRAATLRRRRTGEPDRLESLDALGAEAGWGASEDPSVWAERLARRDGVLRAFSTLSPEDREILLLRDVEGLTGPEVAKVEQHLAGCDWCERFGHAFSGVVKGLRAHLRAERAADALDPERAQRLDERLKLD